MGNVGGSNKSTPFVLEIDGLIGSGKTTLINKCLVPYFESKGLRVTIVKEPVDEWKELLPLFYADPTKYAYLFQTVAFHDRVRECQDKWKNYSETSDIFITERGMLSDMIFVKTLHEQGHINDVELKCYMKWWKLWGELIPFKPDLFIYLSPSMETIMKRVKKRSRPGEEHVSEEYQTMLKKYHDEIFDVDYFMDTPVHKIESDIDFEEHIYNSPVFKKIKQDVDVNGTDIINAFDDRKKDIDNATFISIELSLIYKKICEINDKK